MSHGNDNKKNKKATLGRTIRDEFNVFLERDEKINHYMSIIDEKMDKAASQFETDIWGKLEELGLNHQDEDKLKRSIVKGMMEGKVPLVQKYEIGIIEEVPSIRARLPESEGYINLHRKCKEQDVDVMAGFSQMGPYTLLVLIVDPTKHYGAMKAAQPDMYPDLNKPKLPKYEGEIQTGQTFKLNGKP